MFPSFTARETYIVEANFASWKKEIVFESNQKHCCFQDADTYAQTHRLTSLATKATMRRDSVS